MSKRRSLALSARYASIRSASLLPGITSVPIWTLSQISVVFLVEKRQVMFA